MTTTAVLFNRRRLVNQLIDVAPKARWPFAEAAPSEYGLLLKNQRSVRVKTRTPRTHVRRSIPVQRRIPCAAKK